VSGAKYFARHGCIGCRGLLNVGPNIALDSEQKANYVPSLFRCGGLHMFRAVVEEAAALASLALFIGMIAIWVQVIAVL
jgi:hypothetical protein